MSDGSGGRTSELAPLPAGMAKTYVASIDRDPAPNRPASRDFTNAPAAVRWAKQNADRDAWTVGVLEPGQPPRMIASGLPADALSEQEEPPMPLELYPAAFVDHAREWVADCEWDDGFLSGLTGPDRDDAIRAIPADELFDGLARYFDGGLAAFAESVATSVVLVDVTRGEVIPHRRPDSLTYEQTIGVEVAPSPNHARCVDCSAVLAFHHPAVVPAEPCCARCVSRRFNREYPEPAVPTYADLLAVVEEACAGTKEYDDLSGIAERVLNGTTYDDAAREVYGGRDGE